MQYNLTVQNYCAFATTIKFQSVSKNIVLNEYYFVLSICITKERDSTDERSKMYMQKDSTDEQSENKRKRDSADEQT